MNNLENVKSQILNFNKAFKSISDDLYDEDLDIDIFINIFERIIKDSNYLYDNEIRQTYAIKNEDAISLTLKFYEDFDSEIFERIKRIIFQIEKGTVLKIYNIHSLTKKDLLKLNKLGLPEYSIHGRNYSSSGHCFVYIPTRLELHGKYQNSIINNGYCTLYDTYTLVHELCHCLDTDLTLPCIAIDTFDKNEVEYLFNYTREIFKEVATSFIESMFSKYLLENTTIPKSYIFNHIMLKYNDRVYRANLFFFILCMDEVFKKNKKISIDDIGDFMDRYNYSEEQMLDFFITITTDENILSSIMPYAIDHVFSPILAREMVENTKSGLIKFKRYTKSVINDKLYDIFKIYGINFKRKNYTNLIIDNYIWYY